MQYKTHIATSVAIALPIISLTNATIDPLIIGTIALGSILPDIDSPTSYVSKRNILLSKVASKAGHRKFFHSIYPIIILIITSILMHNLLIFYLTLGYLGHIIGDSFSKSGVPWFYPFNKRKFGVPIYSTGDKIENVIFILATIIVGYFIYDFNLLPIEFSEFINQLL